MPAMRTHVDFRLPDFLEALHPDLLVRYLERFQEEYESTQRQARSKQVDEALAQLATGDFAGACGILGQLPRTAPVLARLLEGPLKCVNDFDCPRGRASLQRAIAADGVDIPADTDPVTAGMRLMLDYPDHFGEALAICHVEQTQDWRLHRGPEPSPVKVTKKAARALAGDFGEMLKESGLTGRCIAQVFEQEERTIIELSHEQYVEALRQFRGRDIEINWTRPVRHARLVYRPSTGLLKVRVYRNDEQLIGTLLLAVGARLFGWEGHFLGDGRKLHLDLSCLSTEPRTVTDPVDRIEGVEVVCLEFARAGDADAVARFHGSGTEHLYRLVRDFCPISRRVQVRHAALQFKFPGPRNTGRRTVWLTEPNSTNLGDDDYDRVIEKYLIRWGMLDGPEPPDADFEPDRRARAASLDMARPGSLFAGGH